MSWLVTPATPPWAEGGNISYIAAIDNKLYRIHEFLTTGTSSLIVLNGGEFEYIIIAGGGGGGHNSVGGGAGGVRLGSTTLTRQNYPIVVGLGGGGWPWLGAFPPDLGNGPGSGANSSAFGFVSTGGGRGGYCCGFFGLSGGSGGGGAGTGGTTTNLLNNGGGEISGQGNKGGRGTGNNVDGGGGGYSSPGEDGDPITRIGGNGGLGLTTTFTGVTRTFAGGGGRQDRGFRAGFIGSENAQANSGSGGYRAGSGGSGIVLVRYRVK